MQVSTPNKMSEYKSISVWALCARVQCVVSCIKPFVKVLGRSGGLDVT